MRDSNTATANGGFWQPLQYPAFAILWTATLISNIGSWMHDVGAGWMMTTLAPSPAWVALVQTATTLPVFLFALPAGALADLLDRRRLIIITSTLMSVVAGLLALMAWMQLVTPLWLLLFSFMIGTGTAFAAPAFQAIVPALVPREALAPAIALNGVGINISRAIGPAVGGLLIAVMGIAWPFMLNALSFLFVVVAVWWWKPAPRIPEPLPAERFRSALVSGLRYARRSRPLRVTLLRAAAFFLFASAYWALLPLVARQFLQGGPQLYGLLMGSVGAGAVSGALALPWLRQRFGANRMVAGGTVVTCGILLLFAVSRSLSLNVISCALAGMAWITVLSSLNVAAQTALPDWVRARGLSVFLMVFFGAMSLGSWVWGQLAGISSIPAALMTAAAGGLVAMALTWRWQLDEEAVMDLSPSAHWPQPLLAQAVDDDHGPVMVTVEYRVAAEDKAAFIHALSMLGEIRRRDGAFAWGVFSDSADAECYLEYFMVNSWLEHLRQHERISVSDRAVQQAIWRYHQGERPMVRHWLAASATTGVQHELA
ncbi:MAG: MFS transporter [Wenzhouxiangellaceae bacterium]